MCRPDSNPTNAFGKEEVILFFARLEFLKVLVFLVLACHTGVAWAQAGKPGSLTCEYRRDPLGLDVLRPRLSWKMQAGPDEKEISQQAYQIQVSHKEDFQDLLWDSRKVTSDQSVHLVYEGPELQSRKRYFWRVKLWDNKNRESTWSNVAFWEMGLLHKHDWKARWVGAPQEEDQKVRPAKYFKKEFTLKSGIRKGRLYLTSLGLYQARLNSRNVTEDQLTPGWTSYHHRLQYQVYDVTDMLRTGENTTLVTVGDGWYRENFGFGEQVFNYGQSLGLLYQLEIEYMDGTTSTIASNDSWLVSIEGPIRFCSIYQGEVYDARNELNSAPGVKPGAWGKVRLLDSPDTRLIASNSVPVRRIEEVPVKKVIRSPKEEWILDFGQNMVGRVRFTLTGQPGDTVTLYHAEVLDSAGNFYRDNLRKAQQKIQYVFADTRQVTYEPHFTFQGFRYVKVDGINGPLAPGSFTGVVIHSDMVPAGILQTSDTLLNQLQQNIKWGQKGNFLDVPTDCPQRDERLGWTGDAQVFARTACFNFNSAPFFTKWLADVRADQDGDGSIPFVVPDVLQFEGAGSFSGSTGWGDAITIIPWTLYEEYGDVRILEQSYESMKSWVTYLRKLAGDDLLIRKGFHFGDWLFFIHPIDWNAKPGYTDPDFISTAFFAHSARLTSRAAGVLGKPEDVEYYQDLFSRIKESFQHEFITPSGRLSPHSQTAYVLALQFHLIEEDQEADAVRYLVENIQNRGYHLSTGFLGTPYLCEVLSAHGREDVAYKLLHQKTYPSWLYPVLKGATTIWERWDGIKPDGSFQTAEMNSFNHYAYGAIGHWMYAEMGGIKPLEPGYKVIEIAPKPDSSMEYVRVERQTLYGKISSEWRWAGDKINLAISIPPNTTAVIRLPGQGDPPVEVGSGDYQFTCMMR